MKYPIGIQSFERVIEEGFVYVDKTDMIYSLVKEGSIYFLSRPRRFGKSLLVSTLKNYFLGRKELFEGLKIDALEKDWDVYPVFHIDFNGDNFTRVGALDALLDDYVGKWEKKYDITDVNPVLGVGVRFKNVIEKAHLVSGKRVVVLVDEYDKPMLDVLDLNNGLEEEHRNILKGFYTVFKAADSHLQFVFLTGVTKFSQVSVFSGFNQPNDISMSEKYDTLCGISQEELDTVFKEPMEKMAKAFKCSFDEVMAKLKAQYDGYHFSKYLTDTYNPFSLLNAFYNNDIQDYWFGTGTPTYLVCLLLRNKECLDELTGKYYDLEEFIGYKATMEKPLPMIYQSGYLTIKDYDKRRERFLLDYPNKEVRKGFLTLVASNYFKSPIDSKSWVKNAAFQLEDGKIDDFRTGLTSFLASIPYNMRRKNEEREKERYFHYTFYLIMRLISVYTVYTEKVQSQGRVVVETKDYIYIFEFKLDGTVEEAMRQIEDKDYAKEYESDRRKLYKIGAVFSSETGTIDDWLCVDR